MTKTEFLNSLADLYRVMNRADHETAEPWTKPDMAGIAGCRPIDYMLSRMVICGAISEADRKTFFNSLCQPVERRT